MRRIKLYWCRSGDPARENFGDAINPILIERLFGAQVEFATRSRCDMIAIGSILDRAVQVSWTRIVTRRRLSPIHVWGSGFIRDGGSAWLRNMTLHALRGRRSAERLRAAAAAPALGDPGLLAPLAYDVPCVGKRHAVAFVPHVADLDDPRLAEIAAATPGATIVDLHDAPENVLATIAAAECVVSTSLHGLVVADALGVPNRWAVLSDRVAGAGYKFDDYFSGVGRPAETPLDLRAGPLANLIDEVCAVWRPIDVERVQKRLLDAFPQI